MKSSSTFNREDIIAVIIKAARLMEKTNEIYFLVNSVELINRLDK